MTRNSSRTTAEAAVDAKCKRFVADMNRIMEAFGGDFPAQLADYVLDADGKLWPVRPSQMGVGDILAFVHSVYGPTFLGFCRRFEQLKVH
jgi:hypothetical protein